MRSFVLTILIMFKAITANAASIEIRPDLISSEHMEEKRIDDPHAGKIHYRGAYLNNILDAKMPGWKKHSHVLFIASDGYRSEVPVAEILNFKPFLATGIVGKKSFEFFDKLQKKTQALGPAYLVWDRETYKELYNHSTLFWPYQVVKIELINKALKAEKSPDHDFVKYCSSCHKEQNYGAIPSATVIAAVVRNQSKAQLKTFLAKPNAVKKNSVMPPIKLADDQLESVYQWLKKSK